MNKVEIPSAVSVTGWNGEKTALAKDKAVASKLSAETTKLADAAALGHADGAGVQTGDDLFHTGTDLGAVRRVERRPVVPGEIDQALQVLGHRK